MFAALPFPPRAVRREQHIIPLTGWRKKYILAVLHSSSRGCSHASSSTIAPDRLAFESKGKNDRAADTISHPLLHSGTHYSHATNSPWSQHLYIHHAILNPIVCPMRLVSCIPLERSLLRPLQDQLISSVIVELQRILPTYL